MRSDDVLRDKLASALKKVVIVWHKQEDLAQEMTDLAQELVNLQKVIFDLDEELLKHRAKKNHLKN